MTAFLKSRFYLTAFLLFYCVTFIKAEQYVRKIQWSKQPQSIHSKDGSTILVPTFTTAFLNEQNGYLPYYVEQFNLNTSGKVTARIDNAIYSLDSSALISNSPLVKSELEIKSAISTYRKHSSVTISILPFRKNGNGQIERLESFTLTVSVNPVGNSRSTGRNYTSTSALASGNWYKVGVNQTGIYKINYDILKNKLSIDLSNVNFNSIGIFGNGGGMIPQANVDVRSDDIQENPIVAVDINGNNRFDADDYILFYAQSPHTWTYDSVTQTFHHNKNIYTEQNFYFITTDRGTAKRVTTINSSLGATQTINVFDDYYFHESNETNIGKTGRDWYGDQMTQTNNTKSFTVSFPNLITTTPVKFNSVVVGNSKYSSNFSVNFNGQSAFTQNTLGVDLDPQIGTVGSTNSSTATITSNSNQITVDYTFTNNDPTSNSNGFIDYFELIAQRSLAMTGSSMNFRSIQSIGISNISTFNLSNVSSTTHVWDVTDPINTKEIIGTNTSGTFSFTVPTPNLREFVAFNTNGTFPTPDTVVKVDNQNLHSIGQPKMVIITPDEFLSAANDLAAFHRSYQNMTVSVVTMKQLYNEFSSGKRDITAIRDFLKMLYDRAGSDSTLLPQYCLLFGDGSYDPKDRLSNNNNFVPTYQSFESLTMLSSFTSDDYFACLDDAEGGNIDANFDKPDVAMGRLPVASLEEAQGVVEKIKHYKSSATLGAWRNMITEVADNPYEGVIDFEVQANNLGNLVRDSFSVYNVDEILADAYKEECTSAGCRFPDVNTAILNRLKTGTLLMNWIGHGAPTNWSHDRIFNQEDIVNLDNLDHLPLFVTATCDFSRFDDPARKSAGEYLITNKNGGGIGSITTVRTVFQTDNTILNAALYTHLFIEYNGRKPTMGELMMATKKDIIGRADLINTRKFILLGDPALTLDYPDFNIVTTSLNNTPFNQPHDSLKALSRISITGEVRDWTGAKVISFNGICHPTIYDKIGNLKTTGNSGAQKVNYQLYNSILFKGAASVVNGDFSFSFKVPQDINYKFGSARISYYADNGNDVDAHGYTYDIVVGGSSDSASLSSEPPTVQLYMNNDQFIKGGITDANPILLAHLHSVGGINTTGNGIGHNITAIFDGDSKHPIVLNDYYEAGLNDFGSGTVHYPLYKLASGKHTVTVKAWDVFDNSTEGTTEFVVDSSSALLVQHLMNYPNPFSNSTQFSFEYNRPGDQLNVAIQIFSTEGRLVRTIQEDITSDGYRIDNIVWDGTDDAGNQIDRGVYPYRLTVHDSEGEEVRLFQKVVLMK